VAQEDSMVAQWDSWLAQEDSMVAQWDSWVAQYAGWLSGIAG